MPRGPRGERRQPDVIGCAVHVAKIATGEIEDTASATSRQPNKAKGGRAGGQARAKALAPERLREIASAGAATRWGK